MHAVDTNVLVRLLVRDDARQATAAETFVAKGAWVSTLVLAETLWVLDAVYQRSPAQIAHAVNAAGCRCRRLGADTFPRAPLVGLLRLSRAGNRPQGRSSASGHLRSESWET